jgi:curved DNA-binding protein CbpA
MNQENYYQILGVNEDATSEQIKIAYRSICKDLHPDKLPRDSGESLKKLAEQRIKMVTVAYSTLNDVDLRREYDLKISNYSIYSEQYETSPKTTTYEELLSDEILEMGFNDLLVEEKEMYNNFCNEIKIIQEHHKDYLSKILNSDLNDFYPDNLNFRMNRFLKIFYIYIPLMATISTVMWLIIFLFACIVEFIFVFIFGSPLGFLVISGFLAFLIPVMSLFLVISTIFSKLKDDHKDSEKKEGSCNNLSAEIKNFNERFMQSGWEIRLSNFRNPLYKDSYVSTIRKKTDTFKNQLKELGSSRKKLIDKFKEIEPNTLQNISYSYFN